MGVCRLLSWGGALRCSVQGRRTGLRLFFVSGFTLSTKRIAECKPIALNHHQPPLKDRDLLPAVHPRAGPTRVTATGAETEFPSGCLQSAGCRSAKPRWESQRHSFLYCQRYQQHHIPGLCRHGFFTRETMFSPISPQKSGRPIAQQRRRRGG